MQVLALVTEAFAASGGIQEFNRHWLTAVASRPDARVKVLAAGGEAWADGPIDQQVAPSRTAYVRQALKLAAQLRPELLLCGHLSLLPLAGWIAQRRPARLWLQLHGIECWQAPARRWRRYGLNQVTLATAVSRYTRERFLAWAPLADHQVAVLPNTVAADCLSAIRGQPEVSGPYLLSVGRLDRDEQYKGHDRVIRLLPELLQTRAELRYVIAGDGNDRSRLQALASDRGVAGRVLFLGQVSRERLLSLYQHAALFVLPSSGEGFGIVYLEALACGCPVLGLGRDGSADPLSLPGAHTAGDDLQASIIAALAKPSRAARDQWPEAVSRRFGLPVFEAQVAALQRRVLDS